MIVATLLLTAGIPQSQTVFDACLRSQSRLSSYSVHVETDSAIPGRKDQSQFDFSVSGSNALFRMREPATSALERSDRSIQFRKNKVLAYDAVANETLSRTAKANAGYLARLTDVLGPLPEALAVAIDPNAMKAFLGRFRGFADWSIKKRSGATTLYRATKGAATMFRFDGDRGLLREVMITIPKSRLHWTFRFSKSANTALEIPSDASTVYTFTLRAAPPKYASADAKQTMDRMLSAYSHLKSGIILVSSRDGNEKLYLSGRKLREERAGFQWTYDGAILSVWNKKTNRFYRGKATRVVLSEYVVAVGAEVDPILRRNLAHRVPFADLLVTGSTVKSVGSSMTNGVGTEILQISGMGPNTSIFVRKDNHLLQSIAAETVDKAGKMLTQSTREYTYRNIGELAPSSVFELKPPDGKVLPLPNVKLTN